MLATLSVTEVNNGSLHYFSLHCIGLLFHQCPGKKPGQMCTKLVPQMRLMAAAFMTGTGVSFQLGRVRRKNTTGSLSACFLRCHPIMGTCITFPSESTKSLTRSGRSLGVTLMPLRTTCTCQNTSTNKGLAALTFSLPAQPSVGATTTAREISGFQWKIIKNV